MQAGPRQLLQTIVTDTGIMEIYDNGDFIFQITDPNIKDEIDKQRALDNEERLKELDRAFTRIMLENSLSLLRNATENETPSSLSIHINDFEDAIDGAEEALDKIDELCVDDEVEIEPRKPTRPSK